MSDPVFAPYVSTYSMHTPYVSPDEFRASPTGVDVGRLVSGGNAAIQTEALLVTLRRASSWADQICNQVLAATVETAIGYYRVQNGILFVPVPYSPVVCVNGYSLGATAANLTAATDLTGVTIEPKVITIPSDPQGSSPQYVNVQYVAGFANCTLTADAAVGDTVLTLDQTLGIAPGQPLSIYDPASGQGEAITVASTTSSTITTAAPIMNAYDTTNTITVTAMPDAIKQAVVYLAGSIIRGRATQSMVISQINSAPSTIQAADPLTKKLADHATMMLQTFARVF